MQAGACDDERLLFGKAQRAVNNSVFKGDPEEVPVVTNHRG